ncbi:phrA [Symbiodinium natans]|uniref:PhrA protein n=1 Tax=Symbiodinium natans TaxID=878477 RepID=A0A812LHX6_9DINO|nr:phrA [Symbiodinium natans]
MDGQPEGIRDSDRHETPRSRGYPSLPFGPGSSPASWDPEDDGDTRGHDDEGESFMDAGKSSEGRKMYFRTLDDSMREQGVLDSGASLGSSQGVSLSSLGIGSSNRAVLRSSEVAEPSDSTKRGETTPKKATTAAASGASQRNLRRARRRAARRGEVLGVDAEPGGCVVLIREDCRLHDNPALHAAAEMHPWVVPLYVHDEDDPSPWPVRGAGLWWRYESLKHFDVSLHSLGSRIIYRKGNLVEQVMDVLLATGASALHFNLQLEPWHHQRDKELECAAVGSLGIDVRTFTAMVMKFEPWEARRSKDEGPRPRREPLEAVRRLSSPPEWPWSIPLEGLGYGRTGGRKIPPNFRQFNEKRQAMLAAGFAVPEEDDWAYEMRRFWPMGEAAAMRRLEEWLKDAAWGCYFPPGLHPRDDAGGRFRADKAWTAMLSPYLRFGDLSARYVEWRTCQVLPQELRQLFLKRVVWRDKAYSQLYRCPDSHSVSIRPQYEQEAWSGTRLQLRRWQRGETGYPLVDAAMRQLWKVGWMCNHLRHVTAQFLIEHLDLSWKEGFAWYDYTLVDTDVAINAMMWQMGGHSGIGSWNFVMHPIYAGKKVDPQGSYVRRWLPELRHLPTEYIHCDQVRTGVGIFARLSPLSWQTAED